jgi:hypothetical protein
MTIVFKDDPYRQNYYRVNMWAGGYQRIINGNHDTSYSFQFYAINGRPADTAFQVVRDGDFFLFSDNGFNGQEKSLPIKFSTIDTSQFQNLTLYAELHTVSPAHYEYFKSLNLYRSTNSSSEPVFIYSNVNNGLGAFVAEHIQSLPIVIK